MRALTPFKWFGAAMAAGALLAACGNIGVGPPTGAGGNGGDSSGLTTSTGSGTVTTSVTTSAGTGGGAHGPGASESVSAGSVCKSQGYRMVFTLGQPTPTQTRTTSSSYRMQGGLVGATEN